MIDPRLDRRAFLQALLGAGAAWALAGCERSSGTLSLPSGPASKPLPPGQLPPVPRPTVRMAGEHVGVPTPFGYNFPTGYFVMAYMYDSLMWPDVRGNLIPWLATRHERSPDGLTWTFELRDGVRWHDGQPLTPADVAFTFEYFAGHQDKLPPFIIFRPQHVASVRPTGPRTVEFRLERPAVTFLDQVAGHVPIVPRHVWASVSNPGEQEERLLVGTGPYRLEAYDRGGGAYRFAANDDFFLGRPFVKRLELLVVGDALTALLAGELDVGGPGLPPTRAALEPFVDNDDFGVVAGPADLIFALYFNTDRRGPLGDVRFRRACAHAIDRERIRDRVGGGLGDVGNPGFLPKGHPYHVAVEQYGEGRSAASDLLDQAGYRRGPNGVRTGRDGNPLRFALKTQPIVPAVGELVADDLEAVGVEVSLEPAQFVPLHEDDFELAIGIHGGHSGDPDLMRTVFSARADKRFFSARYANPEFDEVAEAQLVAADDAERKRLVGRMQQMVAADLPLLHLFYPANVVVHRKKVLDQVAFYRGGLGPSNKQFLVTGSVAGGTEIRPTV